MALTLDTENSTATLTMAEEGKFNPDSLAAFNAALDKVVEDSSVTLLLITGRDKNFSQGLDLEFLDSAEPEAAIGFVKDCMHMVARLLQFPVPVVSVINGHAFGLGFMIAIASDYSVMCADKGFMCLPEIDLGMTLEAGMNALVTGKLQGRVLRDALLTGKRFGGDEAAQAGIVDAATTVDQLMARAEELAQPMRGKDRKTLSGLKADIHHPILSVIEQPVAL
ncbi:enoyl-CoA hydratase/carnithine racemase [Litorivivens lipolytica]|uniref:Enoyl-CoA hydratase/carnithine racemase n=1 Tax=Litorivivens lipolytica TaxID=1524264 RepID=A0A7W4W3Z9_9GAMM|nr:enoyl-CoA hydratase/isomerase family protein [Litorivivens lipolytica]MBB3046920.1 enoyl-CoA hydratase/carnithine racemase [Litorivivens lipolytica]